MVVTRLMSGATKKTDTKIAVNPKAAKTKSGTTRKVDTKDAGKPKTIEFLIKNNLVKECKWMKPSIEDEACCIYMKKEYIPKYYEQHPPRPTWGTLPYDVDRDGQLKFRGMSSNEKAPYIEMAKKDY